MLSVGAMTVRDTAGNFLYVHVIVTDHRVGSVRRGAGRALLDKTKEYARDRGMSAVYVDWWWHGQAGSIL
ncbi:hypothetical protein G6O67_006344 [Ophiocordyceps sinensis]|uniref:Acyl-CoA N-acyltransferase n=1 Tax=Ophiocordyceps sinensis TaxID=72228 RepID=A0A8H4LWJ7_9HYPO|nr:hypothetical protein G6O67_006344 [Ophiocordyceps sinensis]